MDLNKEFPSKFLRKEDVDSGDMVTFINAGRIEMRKFPNQPESKKTFEIGVRLPDGTEKTVSLNATSRNILSNFWGANTEAWVDKKAIITISKQVSFGKLVEILIFQPAEIHSKEDKINAGPEIEPEGFSDPF